MWPTLGGYATRFHIRLTMTPKGRGRLDLGGAPSGIVSVHRQASLGDRLVASRARCGTGGTAFVARGRRQAQQIPPPLAALCRRDAWRWAPCLQNCRLAGDGRRCTLASSPESRLGWLRAATPRRSNQSRRLDLPDRPWPRGCRAWCYMDGFLTTTMVVSHLLCLPDQFGREPGKFSSVIFMPEIL